MNKKKNATHNQKHLTLSDRTFIEQELIQGSSFKYIADVLGKNPTTISKEVKLHRVFYENYMRRYGCGRCSNYLQCREHNVCGDENCKYTCRYCK